MKAILIEPMKHPKLVELDGSLASMYKALECDTITATYPWEEAIGLVTDDEGLYSGKPMNRYVKELEQGIVGNFLLCGLGREDFTDVPDDLIPKFMEMFWKPEQFLRTPFGLMVVQVDDGSVANEAD